MRIRTLAFVVGLVTVVAACSVTTTPDTSAPTSAPAQASSGDAKKSPDTKPPDADGKPTETKRNKEAKTYQESLAFAIADIQAFWTDTMPKAYDGQEYKVIADDHLFPATEDNPGPACTKEGGPGTYDDVKGNAFYCGLGDFVEWDDQTLLPQLYQDYGEYAVAMVFAHEWGHAVQHQVGVLGSGLPTILTENQADCFAGAWTAHSIKDPAKNGFRATPGDLRSALAGMLEFADTPGSDIRGQSAHGSGFDRINGFQVGYENGAARCTEFPDNPPGFVDLSFTTQDEVDASGNVTYEQTIELAGNDLNAYWENLASGAGFTFTPVAEFKQFSAGGDTPPDCGSQSYTEEEAKGTIFFCVDDNYVAWDEDMMRTVSSDIGDFGVAVLLAKQWAVSAQVQDNQPKDQIEGKVGNLQQSCFAGAWTRAVYDGDAHSPVDKNGNPALSLSPGDLDEAIKAFLAFDETPDDKGETATGSAFEQVQAFRDGFISANGAGVCANYTEAAASAKG